MPYFTDRFETLADRYDVVLCDVWGVVHNSIVAFPEAADALARFRQKGGAVVLITNAPRPGDVVLRQLDRLGMPRASYDGIVASGDVTRAIVAQRGGAIYHLGPERDLPLFEGLDVAFAPIERADFSVCSGLFNDEGETPDDYRDLLAAMRARNLFMLCANPDLVVERGHKLLYCAGALADIYHSLGGEVLYAGKPYAPIYEEALAKAQAALGGPVKRARVLAIGDPHGSQRRAGVRHRLPVRDARDSLGGARRAREPGRGRARGHFQKRGHCAHGRHPSAGVVIHARRPQTHCGRA